MIIDNKKYIHWASFIILTRMNFLCLLTYTINFPWRAKYSKMDDLLVYGDGIFFQLNLTDIIY